MKRIETDIWYGGCERAATFSFDDGRYEDYRLVELMNKYGVKGSFHLCNPGFLTSNGFNEQPVVDPKDYKTLYEGHEISCHGEHHTFPARQPAEAIRAEIVHNRAFLENLCKYPVRGMSYPYSDFNQKVIDECRAVGMEYSRTAHDTHAFGIPRDFMVWNPTCHIFGLNEDITERFFAPMKFDGMRLLYIWGHSYEIDTEEKWEKVEKIIDSVANKDGVWYATNIEIYDYVTALSNLKFGADCSVVYNPTATDVWLRADFEKIKVPAGKTVIID